MANVGPPELIELRLKPEALDRHGLPDILYPIARRWLEHALDDDSGGELQLGALLHGLQQRNQAGGADWQALEPAMERLTQLLARDNDLAVVTAAGGSWWVETGPVDLAEPIITIQRGDELVAAICRRDDGRLRLATYRPLDGKSAGLIISLSRRPHPDDGTVCMRENNWEYALDCSAGMGQYYAFTRGEAYLSYWPGGFGDRGDGPVDPASGRQRQLIARRPAAVAVELGVAFAFS